MILLSAVLAALHELFVMVAHVQNSSFPRPLTAAQERDCLSRMAGGDLDARRQLIECNLRLVAHVIKKFESSGEDKEDLIQIGTIGLIKAINTFKPEKGIRLATYAARCIENELLMYFRSTRRLSQEVSLQESIGIDKEGNEITLMEVLSCEDSILDQVEARLLQEKLLQKVNKLKKREKKVLTMRFGLGQGLRHTQKEIASELGISRSYVSRIEKKAIQKLIQEFSM